MNRFATVPIRVDSSKGTGKPQEVYCKIASERGLLERLRQFIELLRRLSSRSR